MYVHTYVYVFLPYLHICVQYLYIRTYINMYVSTVEPLQHNFYGQLQNFLLTVFEINSTYVRTWCVCTYVRTLAVNVGSWQQFHNMKLLPTHIYIYTYSYIYIYIISLRFDIFCVKQFHVIEVWLYLISFSSSTVFHPCTVWISFLLRIRTYVCIHWYIRMYVHIVWTCMYVHTYQVSLF